MEKEDKIKAKNGNGSHTEVLTKLFYTLSDPDSFSNPSKLLKRAKKEGLKITLKEVKNWLTQQVAYTRHSKPTYVFPRRKVLTLRIDECWASDLIQVDGLASYNAGYQYILVNIDLFSKKIFLRKLRHKSKKEMEMAFRSIFQENGGKSPYRLWTDLGKEYTSLSAFYNEMEIDRYSTNSPLKSVFVENANKSIENLLYKKMTSENSARWIDHLQDVASHLNSKKTKKLYGLSPNEAHLKKNEEYLRALYLKEYKKYKNTFKNQKPKFFPGDTVRILKNKTVFTRGYTPAFSRELYTVKSIKRTYPLSYSLEGIRRTFYRNELRLASEPYGEQEKGYFIERTRIVNTTKHRSGKVSGGQKQYLLKARNNQDLSTWISEFEYHKLKKDGLLD